jgi:hypothetical protein
LQQYLPKPEVGQLIFSSAVLHQASDQNDRHLAVPVSDITAVVWASAALGEHVSPICSRKLLPNVTTVVLLVDRAKLIDADLMIGGNQLTSSADGLFARNERPRLRLTGDAWWSSFRPTRNKRINEP